MSTNLPEPLNRAVDYLHARQLPEARALLVAYLREHPESDTAWYLLSLALTDRAQQRDSLKRALQANPANTAAQERLAGLNSAQVEEPERFRQPPPALVVPPAQVPAVDPAAGGPEGPEKQPAQAHSPLASVNRPGASHEPGLPSPRALPVAARRPRDPSTITLIVLGVVFAVVVCIGGILYVLGVFTRPPAEPIVITALASPIPTLAPTLPAPPPATWTVTPPAMTPTASPAPPTPSTPTPAPVIQGTLVPPNPTVVADMDQVEKQVSEVRGLALQGSVTRYLIPPGRVEDTLRGLIINPALVSALENQKISLSVVGLITATYDMARYALNQSSDSLGGFYLPSTNGIYVIGSQFAGVERFVYAHEFDRALTDHHFHIGDPGRSAGCASNTQRCDALRALAEGDATLLMSLWLRQDGSLQDAADLAAYKPVSQTLPDESPPPYVLRQLAFPHVQGLAFVSQLYQQGGWAAVNAAYTDLPASTEQILHPDKYLVHEAPITVTDAALSVALGSDYRKLDEGIWGEWSTYLILGYGLDPAARLDDITAATAAAGWGGDHYQTYYSDTTQQTVLAAHWVWDTPQDATEFAAAMRKYQDLRYRGLKVNRDDGACWANDGQGSCTFTTGTETLWLLAPNQTVLNKVLALFPRFH